MDEEIKLIGWHFFFNTDIFFNKLIKTTSDDTFPQNFIADMAESNNGRNFTGESPNAEISDADARRTANGRLLATRRLQRDLKQITEDPPCLCSAKLIGEDLFSWIATITGPSDSAYEGGTFRLLLKFSDDYPFNPPQVSLIYLFSCIFFHTNWSTSKNTLKRRISCVNNIMQKSLYNHSSLTNGSVARIRNCIIFWIITLEMLKHRLYIYRRKSIGYLTAWFVYLSICMASCNFQLVQSYRENCCIGQGFKYFL